MRALDDRRAVEELVNGFYGKVKADDLLAPLFGHVPWDTHLPIMYDFWSSMLLGENVYKRNPFEKHLALPLRPEHFDRWIELFNTTVDERFVGPTADEAKQRAASIARVWQHKMGLYPVT